MRYWNGYCYVEREVTMSDLMPTERIDLDVNTAVVDPAATGSDRGATLTVAVQGERVEVLSIADHDALAAVATDDASRLAGARDLFAYEKMPLDAASRASLDDRFDPSHLEDEPDDKENG